MKATQVALLGANYMMKRLDGYYPILFRNENGMCAHEFIIDCRGFKKKTGVEVIDIAKRMQDYGTLASCGQNYVVFILFQSRNINCNRVHVGIYTGILK